MRHGQLVTTQTENITNQQKKDLPKQARPDGGDGNWQLKILMVIIGLGVLMLILKSLGVV